MKKIRTLAREKKKKPTREVYVLYAIIGVLLGALSVLSYVHFLGR